MNKNKTQIGPQSEKSETTPISLCYIFIQQLLSEARKRQLKQKPF